MVPQAASTALVFPGQGAPAPFWREATVALKPHLLELAGELAGADPFARFGESTEFDQLAVYCASIAAFESLGRPEADFCAGHSLGEIAALQAADVFSEEDGVRIVAARGRAMARAGAGLDPGGMLAVRAGEAELAGPAARHGVAVANLNAPRQTVLSGTVPALEAVAGELEAAGIRGKRLTVTDAFHSPRMAAAAEELSAAIAELDLRAARRPVLSGIDGEPITDPRAALVAALTAPVRWIDVVEQLSAAGVRRYVEVGPGKALARMVAQTLSAPLDVVLETTPLPAPNELRSSRREAGVE